jgi:hypothetical protein
MIIIMEYVVICQNCKVDQVQRVRMAALFGVAMMFVLGSTAIYSNAQGYTMGAIILVPLTIMNCLGLICPVHLEDNG